MVKIDTRVAEDLEQQIIKYAAMKKISKSQAIRELIEAGIDVTAHESELLKEIKFIKSQLRDEHEFNKKGFDRLASLSVKNGNKIFAIWHAILIQIFLRSKDKGIEDSKCVQSRDEALKTATTLGINEYNNKG